MVARATQRYSHGSLLSEKQGIQWLISESAIELYQAKLMVLHAAYRIEHGLPFTTEVSMAKHHVANTLWRVVDRAVQVHGALGYSKDSPLSDMLLQARWSRFADGADEIHKWRVAEAVIAAYNEHGTTRVATGDLPAVGRRERPRPAPDLPGSSGRPPGRRTTACPRPRSRW